MPNFYFHLEIEMKVQYKYSTLFVLLIQVDVWVCFALIN